MLSIILVVSINHLVGMGVLLIILDLELPRSVPCRFQGINEFSMYLLFQRKLFTEQI